MVILYLREENKVRSSQSQESKSSKIKRTLKMFATTSQKHELICVQQEPSDKLINGRVK